MNVLLTKNTICLKVLHVEPKGIGVYQAPYVMAKVMKPVKNPYPEAAFVTTVMIAASMTITVILSLGTVNPRASPTTV